MASETKDRLRKVERILITQDISEHARSHYSRIAERYNLHIDYRPFTEVQGVSAREFRRQKINFDDFTAVIFTSKNAIEHFFRIAEESRYKVGENLKYFCTSEAVSLYLQKHTVFRKRRIFNGPSGSLEQLKTLLAKHRKKESFLLPCSNTSKEAYSSLLADQDLKIEYAVMYETVSADLSDLRDVFYDILVFMNPQSIAALYENFPDFKQNYTRIAAFGHVTIDVLRSHHLIVDIQPDEQTPSMIMALEQYVRDVEARLQTP